MQLVPSRAEGKGLFDLLVAGGREDFFTEDGDMARCFDADAHLVAVALHHRDDDSAVDHDLLVQLAAQDEHLDLLAVLLWSSGRFADSPAALLSRFAAVSRTKLKKSTPRADMLSPVAGLSQVARRQEVEKMTSNRYLAGRR